MRLPELKIKRARGQLLIVAVFVLVVIAVAIAAMANMTSADIRASSGHAQSEQAYFAAVSGLEVATREFANGTACGSLTFPGGAIANTQVGSGTFATSGTLYPTAFTATLRATIANNNTVPKIPLTFTGGSIASLAPHGEILIDNEFITYSGTSAAACTGVAAPCLSGVIRATNGTTIASHTGGVGGAAITQLPQCVIRSTGTVQSAKRIVEITVPSNSAGVSNSDGVSNFYNGAATALANGVTTPNGLTGGDWSTGLPAGDNYVIAIITFSESTNTGTASSVALGNLRLRTALNTVTLDASTSIIRWGNGTTPSGTIFPQETQVLLARDAGAPANANYRVQVVTPSINGTNSARAQILVINGIAAANAAFAPSLGLQTLNVARVLATSPNTPLPAGNNIIIAQVQIDNAAGGARNIPQNQLVIRRGILPTSLPILMGNQFTINLAATGVANEGTGYLLLAIDPGAAAGQQYVVTGLANNTNVNATASILVINGFSAAEAPPYVALPPPVPFGVAPPTSLGSVTTDTSRAGERVVLAANQYSNTTGAQRTIGAGNTEAITLGGTAVASINAYTWALCPSSTSALCDDYFTGLLWRQPQAPTDPVFGVQSQASGANMTGATNILTIDLSVREINRMEIYP